MFVFGRAMGSLLLVRNMTPWQITALLICLDMLFLRGHGTYLFLSIFTDEKMVLVVPIAFGATLQDAFLMLFNLFWGLLQLLADAFL